MRVLWACLLLVGCPDASTADFDGDGTEDFYDCAPADPDIHPGAPEIRDDGIDQDCNGSDLACDADGDGVLAEACGGLDCDDTNANRFTGAVEACNALDDDCDGDVPVLEVDADEDGFAPCEGDCSDFDAARAPGLDEVCDGKDHDCDTQLPAGEIDGDGDGFLECAECDDTRAQAFPGATEVCNGLDDDCDTQVPDEELDEDGDGQAACAECDDGDASVFVGADEACNGLDDDCDGVVPTDEADTDGDSFSACAGDCEPTEPTAFPGAVEACDGLDTDCDGTLPTDEADVDGDGLSTCEGDCDDQDASIHPGAGDLPLDGVDADCSGVDGVDADGDGFAGLDFLGPLPPELAGLLDCDDNDPALNLADADGDGSTTCGGDCDDLDATVEALDADGDGIDTCGPDGLPDSGDEDCDDGSLAVFPGATEACDGVDTDCDGALGTGDEDTDGDTDPACADCNDNNAMLSTLDVDRDGYLSCGPDCNNADAAVHPLAADLLGDGVDSNCDSTDGIDNDGDGYAQGQDCDDSNAAMNLDDVDGDGASTCADDCDDQDATQNPTDADLDGFDTCSGDCNDGDYAVNPGATEVCDLVDNNCDLVQENELDGDGDGDPACSDCNDDLATIHSFDLDGDTWSLCTNDCDDTSIQFNPIALDPVGDGFDTNCDLLDGVDSDGDQFASEPSGGTDCDDDDPSINPEAEDFPGDGIDSDCDGLDLPDADGDGYGALASGGTDCNDNDAAIHPGFLEEDGDGADLNCDGLDGNLRFSFVAPASTRIGEEASRQAVCDINGDGSLDLAIGMPEGGSTSQGIVAVFYGPLTGSLPMSGADATLQGPTASRFGVSVACVGDGDGDGVDEIAIGATTDATGGLGGTGAVYFASGTFAGTVPFGASSDRLVTSRNTGGGAADRLGRWVVAAGDVDGDGLDDVLVATGDIYSSVGPSPNIATYSDALVYLVSGPPGGSRDVETTAAAVFESTTGGLGGMGPIAGPGDLNGDSYDDIVVGVPTAGPNEEGAAYVFFGPVSGSLNAGTPNVVLEGGLGSSSPNPACATSGNRAGQSVQALGDLNGDGFPDLAVTGHNGCSGSWLSILLGPILSDQSLSFADIRFTPETWGGSWPVYYSVAPAGDLDLDGHSDLVVTTVGFNSDPAQGGAWAFFGPFPSTVLPTTNEFVAFTERADPYVEIFAPVPAGDLDGDGIPDLLIAEAWNGDPQPAGSVLLFPGPYR